MLNSKKEAPDKRPEPFLWNKPYLFLNLVETEAHGL